jgi:hypothetical protein
MAAVLCIAATTRLPLYGQASVFTWQNDNARTGQNLQETSLTTANVNSSAFGRLFTITVDGRVDAEPLYAPSLVVNQGPHNVLFVVTEHGSAYAFDADTGAQLWHVSLLLSGETPSDNRGCGQVSPEIGITSTPVIDPRMGPHGTIYMVAMSKNGSTYHQRLHALDLTTGSEEFSGPTEVQATYSGNGDGSAGGVVPFDPKQYKERAGLLLLNGIVYTSWASHCDIFPYTAWVIGYDQTNLSRVSVLNLTPNGHDGSVWAAGAGPAADSQGNIYVLLANGTFDTTLTQTGFPASGDYGNGFVKIAAGGTSVADYFTMNNTVAESNADQDLGSGGAMLLPPLNDSQGHPRDLAVGAGKDGNIYVVDRANMGKFNQSSNGIYQELPAAVGQVFSSPAWFGGKLYYGGVSDTLKAFTFANGSFAQTSHTVQTFAYPGTTPSISANGSSNGIVWSAENSGTAVLHAFDAANLSTELYNSNTAANSRDHFGAGNKYIVPMVANGKVYVGTTTGVGGFGLLCGAAPLQFPAYNGSGLSLNPTLSWAAATGGTSYDVALSTTNPPGIVASGLTTTSYSVTTALTPGKQYFWYVTAHNCAGTVQSTTWSFVTAGSQDIGVVDLAGNANGNATVPQGGSLNVSGWAADTATGSPVQSVTIFVDGNSKGTATLNGARPDVASSYGRSDFNNSGWSFQMPASTLSLGQHTVTATAVGLSGTAPLAGSKTINVVSGQEIGTVDLGGSPSGSSTVSHGGSLFVAGWAADTATGAPVQSVTIFVDSSSVGAATLNLARSDVANAYGRNDFTNSGWSFQMAASTLSLGQHTVTATAAGLSGTAPLPGSKIINVVAGQEIGVVDLAGNVDGTTAVTKGNTLRVAGWAADTATGAPVQSVTIFVDGNSAGTATLSISRPDVASAYNRSDFTNSGWNFQTSTSSLSLGQHTISATAVGSSGTAPLGSKTVTIQ